MNTLMNKDGFYWEILFKAPFLKLIDQYSRKDLEFISSDDENEILVKVQVNTSGYNEGLAREIASLKLNDLLNTYSIITGKELPFEYSSFRLLHKPQNIQILKGSVSLPVIVTVIGKVFGDQLLESENLLEKINKRDDYETLKKIIRWYRRSLKSNDIYDKFIYLWFAFNATYNHFRTENSEIIRIDGLIRSCIYKDHIKLILDNYSEAIALLSNMNIFSSNKKIDWGYKLKTSLINNDNSKAIRNIARCIYYTRCELFHGEKQLSNTTKKLIASVYPLLDAIFRQCFISLL